ILLFAFGIGVIWGPLGVAYGALVATYAVLWLRVNYTFDDTPATGRAFFRAINTPVLASAAMASLLLTINSFISASNPLTVLAIALPLSVGIYVLAWVLLPHGKETIRALADDLVVSLRLERHSATLKAGRWRRVS